MSRITREPGSAYGVSGTHNMGAHGTPHVNVHEALRQAHAGVVSRLRVGASG
jgi:hypothetical protein